jgi:hypothetical protein
MIGDLHSSVPLCGKMKPPSLPRRFLLFRARVIIIILICDVLHFLSVCISFSCTTLSDPTLTGETFLSKGVYRCNRTRRLIVGMSRNESDYYYYSDDKVREVQRKLNYMV